MKNQFRASVQPIREPVLLSTPVQGNMATNISNYENSNASYINYYINLWLYCKPLSFYKKIDTKPIHKLSDAVKIT